MDVAFHHTSSLSLWNNQRLGIDSLSHRGRAGEGVNVNAN